MVATYTIFGRQVGSHVLAMATLGGTALVARLATRGGEKKKDAGPAYNATSQDEEKFIKEFIQQANMDEMKEKH